VLTIPFAVPALGAGVCVPREPGPLIRRRAGCPAVIVVDASAMIEALVGRGADTELLDALAGDIDAPHLLDVEVLSVLRGLVLGGELDPNDAVRAREDHFAFAITRHEAGPLAGRIWQLRHQFNSYDASYLALAEALPAPLFHVRQHARNDRPQRRDPPHPSDPLNRSRPSGSRTMTGVRSRRPMGIISGTGPAASTPTCQPRKQLPDPEPKNQ